ncbi:hypothetical protein EE612_035282 [Oryza sativa]|uniref:Uncharacterized protein n=1 Tax=Oryza glaberrima TaxID=4538 RepID=I1Q3K9_ORYGL|nr:hypothetical protein EE612_035282 [Oryza sativa]
MIDACLPQPQARTAAGRPAGRTCRRDVSIWASIRDDDETAPRRRPRPNNPADVESAIIGKHARKRPSGRPPAMAGQAATTAAYTTFIIVQL